METSFELDPSIGSGQPVTPWIKHAPTIITVGIIVILALHGRIAQPVHYNEFADRSADRPPSVSTTQPMSFPTLGSLWSLSGAG